MILLFEHLCSNLNDAIVLEDSLVENSKLAVGSEKINQLLLQALLPILLGAKAKIFLPVHRLSNEYGWINLDILIIMIQYKKLWTIFHLWDFITFHTAFLCSFLVQCQDTGQTRLTFCVQFRKGNVPKCQIFGTHRIAQI